MYSKKVTAMKEPLEIDLQLAAIEIDTSVLRMRYLSNTLMEDGLLVDAFNKLWDEIRNVPEISSLDDNTVLKEFVDEPIIIHETLSSRYLIYDVAAVAKIEEVFDSYKE